MSANTGGGQNPEAVMIPGPEGRPVSFQLIYDVSEAGREVRVFTTRNRMKAFIDYVKMDPSRMVTDSELERILLTAGICYGIDHNALEILARLLNTADGEGLGLFIVALGLPPQQGVDGHVDFLVRPTSREPRYEVDESGNINYKQLNFFENAVTGQHVASVYPPTKGRSGRDIFGRELSASDGKPVSLRIGEGVRYDELAGHVYALSDGRLEFEKNVLSLNGLYEVRGDVDMKVGNIDFVGEVIVRGSVLDDFNITGLKGITIHGSVGNSSLNSNGDIVIDGGVAAKKKGCISSKGNVRARYLNETLVEIEGDLFVKNEIVHSNVNSRGRVIISDGTILGGCVVALKGVEAKSVGSPLGITTRINAGFDWTTERKLLTLNAELEKLEGFAEVAAEALEPVLKEKAKLAGLSAEEREPLNALIDRLRELREKISILEEKRLSYKSQKVEGRVCQINVKGRLYPGSDIHFPDQHTKIKDSVRGPISVIEDMKKQMVRIADYSPLAQVDAQDKPSTSDE